MTNEKTSYKRLVAAILIGFTMLSVALLTPALVLLSVKIINLDPKNYTNTYGFAVAIGTFFAIIAPPLGGALGDHTHLMLGKRRVWLLVGAIVGAVGMLMMGFSTNVTTLVIGWMIVQFFYNIAGASFSSLVPDQVPEEKRASFSGLIGLAQPLGVLIGNVLAGALNVKFPILLWIILTIFGLAGPIITSLMIKDTAAVKKTAGPKKSVGKMLGSIFPNPRKYPNYTKAFFLKIFILMGYGAGTYLPIMLARKFGFSGNHAGQVVAIVNIASLVFAAGMSLAGGFLSDKIKRQRPLILAGAISMIIGLMLYMTATGIPVIIIGGIFLATGFGLFNSADASLVLRVLPNKEDAGKDYGLMTSANNLQGVLIPLLAPLLLKLGGWYAFFIGLAIICALGIVMLYSIPEDPRYAASKQAAAEEEGHHVPVA